GALVRHVLAVAAVIGKTGDAGQRTRRDVRQRQPDQLARARLLRLEDGISAALVLRDDAPGDVFEAVDRDVELGQALALETRVSEPATGPDGVVEIERGHAATRHDAVFELLLPGGELRELLRALAAGR